MDKFLDYSLKSILIISWVILGILVTTGTIILNKSCGLENSSNPSKHENLSKIEEPSTTEKFHIESRILPPSKSLKDMKIGDSGYINNIFAIPKDSNNFYILPDFLIKSIFEKSEIFNILITLTDSGYLATIPISENFRRSPKTSKELEDLGCLKINTKFE